MKKLVLTAAVLGFAASMASAQVYSQNIVGYSKSDNSGYTLVGNQFLGDSTAPSAVLGDQMDYGTQLYVFDGDNGYQTSTYNQGFFGGEDSWSNDSLDLGLGVGFWVSVPTGTNTTMFAGEVNTAAQTTNSIVSGFQILSYPYPVESKISEMGFVPQYGDQVFVWTPNGYSSATYNQGFFGDEDSWSVDLVIGIGEGFWYSSSVDVSWIAERPF